MKINFNSTTQPQPQKPSFGVKYGFRAKDVAQLKLYLTGEDSFSIANRKLFTGLVECMERHNADETLHKGVLDVKATVLDVPSVGCSDKKQINVGVLENGNPYKMFYANRKFTGKFGQIKKLFREINSKIISDRLGVAVEQRLPKKVKSQPEVQTPTLIERIEALSGKSF